MLFISHSLKSMFSHSFNIINYSQIRENLTETDEILI